jgi:hypothetical protein
MHPHEVLLYSTFLEQREAETSAAQPHVEVQVE